MLGLFPPFKDVVGGCFLIIEHHQLFTTSWCFSSFSSSSQVKYVRNIEAF
ncbi:hypothetical protein HanRHA438_Chr03g0132851 [Helianthus annuus]|nr:hypothetical protein HanRHA438_Chr03g0132851 [Helianthus annuus]